MSDVKSSKSEHSLEEKMIHSIFLTQTSKKLQKKLQQITSSKMSSDALNPDTNESVKIAN